MLACVFKYVGSNVVIGDEPYAVDLLGRMSFEMVAQQLQRRVAQLCPDAFERFHAVKLCYNGIELTQNENHCSPKDFASFVKAWTQLKALQSAKDTCASDQRALDNQPDEEPAAKKSKRNNAVTIYVTKYNKLAAAMRGIQTTYSSQFSDLSYYCVDANDGCRKQHPEEMESVMAILEAVDDNLKRKLRHAAIKANPWHIEYFAERSNPHTPNCLLNCKQLKTLALEAVASCGFCLAVVGDALQDDVDVVTAAVTEAGIAIMYASWRLVDNDAVVKAAVRSQPESVQYASLRLRSSVDVFKSAYSLRRQCNILLYASADVRRDEEVMFLAVYNARDYHYFSQLSRAFILRLAHAGVLPLELYINSLFDQEVVYATLDNGNASDWHARAQSLNNFQLVFEYLDSKAAAWYPDKQTINKWVRINGGLCLQFVTGRHKSAYDDTTLIAVQDNGLALQFARPDLQSDFETVLAAVRNNGRALRFASGDLRNNDDIVHAAVHCNGLALEYASRRIKAERGLVLAAVTNNGLALQFASGDLRNNDEIVHAAVQCDGNALEYASRRIKAERGLVLAAVTLNGSAIEFADESLQHDRDVALAAVTSALVDVGHPPIMYLPDNFRKDKEIASKAMKQLFESVSYIGGSANGDRIFAEMAAASLGFSGVSWTDNFKNDLALLSIANCVSLKRINND